MRYQIAFRNVRPSVSVKDFAEKKLEDKLAPLVANPISAEVVVSKSGANKSVVCHLKGGDGLDLTASHEGRSLRDSVNGMIAKLQRQVRREKDRQHDQKGEISVRNLDLEEQTEALA